MVKSFLLRGFSWEIFYPNKKRLTIKLTIMLICGNILLAALCSNIFINERMIKMIEKNTRHVVGNFTIPDNKYHEKLKMAHKSLYEGDCLGAEMLGWLKWPEKYLQDSEYARVKAVGEKIRKDSDAVVVVGIGGSYLTPKMIIESQCGEFYNETANKKGLPRIYYAGCDLSPDRLNRILELISDCNWSIIYISKSGGTMEPALAFRVLWNALFEKYGDEADSRVYTVTDAKKGTLKMLTNEHNWESFVIPDNIGGRYSGLTAVGLLPIAVAGIDTDLLLKGASDAMHDCEENYNSFAAQYAEYVYYNYKEKGIPVELLAMSNPDMRYAAEWEKQLFGESEGKDGKGVFPTSVIYTTDLHSLGQPVQEGKKGVLFETINKSKFKGDFVIPESSLNDNLDKYVGKRFSQANEAAMDGVFIAHSQGGNPCAETESENTLEAMGARMYYDFVKTSLVCIMMGVNAYNQPGVEFYKRETINSSKWDE